MLRLIEYNYPLLFSRFEFVYDCVCVFCFVSVLCTCEFFFLVVVIFDYISLKENKNKHFPDIVCWQKPSYHFCMCLFYFLEICKSQWLISSSSCLPSFHSFWMLAVQLCVPFVCNETSFEWERVLLLLRLLLPTQCETKVTNNFYQQSILHVAARLSIYISSWFHCRVYMQNSTATQSL